MNYASSPQSVSTGVGQEAPGMAKALTIGVTLGIALSFFGVAGALLLGGRSLSTAVGLGVFVAIWGGLGFGGMIGGVVWATRAEEAAKRDRDEAREAARLPVDRATLHAQETLDVDGSSPLTQAQQ